MSTDKPTPSSRIDSTPSWADITAFQRDLVVAIAHLEQSDREQPEHDDIHGLAVLETIEKMYDEPINHGRLYPNLDELVDKGLIEKGLIDRRTNSYNLTDAAERILEGRAYHLADLAGIYGGDK